MTTFFFVFFFSKTHTLYEHMSCFLCENRPLGSQPFDRLLRVFFLPLESVVQGLGLSSYNNQYVFTQQVTVVRPRCLAARLADATVKAQIRNPISGALIKNVTLP